jgi:hypothetical protein
MPSQVPTKRERAFILPSGSWRSDLTSAVRQLKLGADFSHQPPEALSN